MTLVDSLIKDGWLRTPRIIKAFKKIHRSDFLPEDSKDFAEVNSAFPIGFGQTISQPLVVAFMLEKLQPLRGEKILDVGSGSGWTTALLAEIVGSKGKVIGVEVIKELRDFGHINVAKYNFIKKGIVEFALGDGSKGFEAEAPFNKILCSATAKEVPQAWKDQLKLEGRIVTPIGTSIWLFIKQYSTTAESSKDKGKPEIEFAEFEYPGFVFVPLIEK
jgi:protein-L-isoaspartate(D-aspartate) O-methyltransferase